jgi:glucose-6-phosphate isomerase
MDPSIRFQTSAIRVASELTAARTAFEGLLKRYDLGFWQLPEREEIWRTSLKAGKSLRQKSKHLVVLGMGGSALGGKCLVECLAPQAPVTFLANTDPAEFAAILENKSTLAKSHFLAVSKSGGTLELACMLDVLGSRLKKSQLAKRLTVITEPTDNPLRSFAVANHLDLIDHPTDVGGRFSALTPVGLVPAAFAGVRIPQLKSGAETAVANAELIAGLAAHFSGAFARGETVTAFWSYVHELRGFLPWLQQLWAESLGKSVARNGQKANATSVPVAYEGTCDQHSVLQQLMQGLVPTSIVFLRDLSKERRGPKLSGQSLAGYSVLKSRRLGEVFMVQSRATEEALKSAGRTTMSLELSRVGAVELGELMMTFELLIGTLGELLNMDAFDQPGVELGKKITKSKLQELSSSGR